MIVIFEILFIAIILPTIILVVIINVVGYSNYIADNNDS